MPVFELRRFGMPVETIWTDDEARLRSSLRDRFGESAFSLRQRPPDCCNRLPCACSPATTTPKENR